MKIAIVVASAALAALCGCASPIDPRASAAVDQIDHAHVAAVEHAARNTGVSVYWINLPYRKDVPVGVTPALGEPTGT